MMSYHQVKAKHQETISKRKRVLIIGLFVTFVVLTFPVVVLNLIDADSFDTGVHLANYRQLQVDMHEDEVEKRLGSKGRVIVPLAEECVRPLRADEKFWKG